MLARLTRTLRDWFRRPRLRYRLEAFGGIAMSEQPPLLLTLSREGMRALGVSAAWPDDDPGPPSVSSRRVDAAPRYSAPVEAHLALTNACPAACDHCYMDSGKPLPGELGLEGMKDLVDRLANAGVFHVALGGGESMLLDWVFDIAAYARSRGLVPNLTTSGLGLTERKAARCGVFGRINVSMDGIGQTHSHLRTDSTFSQADRAVRLLRAHHDRVGINTVVTRHNVDRLEDVVAYAADLDLDEVEFLRLKPAGRGTALYLANRLTPQQSSSLLGRLLELRRAYPVTLKVDCSFAPFVAGSALADPEHLALFSVLGCEGGDYLVGIDATGNAHPCSFESEGAVPADRLAELWDDGIFKEYRGYRAQAPEPCASCPYAAVCRGGCRVVARYLTGDPAQPDPECPRVMALSGEGGFSGSGTGTI